MLRRSLALAALAAAAIRAAALGTADSATGKTAGSDGQASWTVAVAAADGSSLPPAFATLAGKVDRSLAAAVRAAGSRKRPAQERETVAGRKAADAAERAAKVLAAKVAARDDLAFKGYSASKRRSELAKADADVAAARSAYDETRARAYEVGEEAAVVLDKESAAGKFAALPSPGGEGAFCSQRSADALLAAELSVFRDRAVVAPRVWIASSWSWMDLGEYIFDPAEAEAALAEMELGIAAGFAARPFAALEIDASEAGARVFVDGVPSGRGGFGPSPRRAGSVAVEAEAPGFLPARAEVELAEGRLTRVGLELEPVPPATIAIRTEEAPARIYGGSLFVGDSPLGLVLPSGTPTYLFASDEQGREARAVVVPRPGAAFELDLRRVPAEGEKPVKAARDAFYGAFGRFSLTLPVAMLASGVMNGYYNAAMNGVGGQAAEDGYYAAQAATWAASAVAAVFLGESVFRLVGYLGASSSQETRRARER